MQELIEKNFGFLFEPELIQEIVKVGKLNKVPAGTTLMKVGEPFEFVPLLISGVIRILREDADGHEMFLYYLEGGDTCAMTLNNGIESKKSEIIAVAEEDSVLVMIPADYLDQWLCKYKSWRNYVFHSYQLRFQEILESFDSIAFMKMDERLLKYLTDKVKVTGSTVIANTHQEIASELNTSRVVISRLLKQMERAGKVKMLRNKLELLDF